MIYQDLTEAKQVQRLWDIEDIKKLIHTRVYYIANEWREQELDDLWTKTKADTASFGSNTGYYVGMESIRNWYTQIGDRSVGYLTQHPVSTDLVEVAKDGKTARGLWFSIGQETVPGKAMWMSGKLAVDFIKEDGQWKIWHLVDSKDVVCGAGEDFRKSPVYWKPEEDPTAIAFGKPDVAVLTHDPNFNWWDDYPAMPEPYDTWQGGEGYGPEGFRPPVDKGLKAGEGRNYQ